MREAPSFEFPCWQSSQCSLELAKDMTPSVWNQSGLTVAAPSRLETLSLPVGAKWD
jgi:hypothetical protein